MLKKQWHTRLLRVCLGMLVGAMLLLALPQWARIVYAHAVLVRSEPAANAQLAATPHEIRLWFTEPLEPTYSSIVLRDATGATVSTLPSYIEPTDDHQLVLMVDSLADGIYTVVWRNVSSADGHQQSGSFPFIIGAARPSTTTASVATNALASFDMLARWVNFWGQALAVGSVAFMVFVWQPTLAALMRGRGRANADALNRLKARPLWIMAWIGWLVAGVGAGLLLLNQAAILLGTSLAEVVAWATLLDVINSTRFGTLWLWRMALWLVMGLLLVGAGRMPRLAWLATVGGLAMLLPTSMHSHAAVSNDVMLSIFSDWVHLAMTALWVGGLVQFLFAIPVLIDVENPDIEKPDASQVGVMTAYFSNFARVAVAGLIVTGIYATWHQVTTLEALTTTFYGRLLSIKLLLVALLVIVAAINLLWTQRRLMAGQAVWIERLHGLVSVEIFLVFAVLLVVGAMTAVNPARNEVAQREAAAMIPPAPEVQPIHVTQDVDDLQVHFTASPGWVGNSTFVVQLVDETGAPVPDASLIRLRFEQQGGNAGESEVQIRPEAPAADGIYSIEGANLSATGDWRLRMTVQRPDAFDAIVDFDFAVAAPPPPPPAPVIENDAELPYRASVLRLVGVAAVALGALFIVQARMRFWQGAGLMATILFALGVAYLVTGMLPLT